MTSHAAQYTKSIDSHPREMENSLLSITAHELKTPLTSMKLMVHFLANCIQKGGKKCISLVNLGAITHELERTTALVNAMARSSDTNEYFGRLNKTVVNVQRLIHKEVKNGSYYTNKHKILFSNTSSLQVLIDENRIRQVVINLLSNAIKYSPQGSTIHIKAKKQKQYAIISIKDQGKGIPRQDMIAIFDKHYRVPHQKEKGQGLGLHIVKEIIRNHQGKIWITSKVGKGSTFYFSLPLLTKGNRKTSPA